MQLIVILLSTVSVLTFLSGAIVYFGSAKAERAKSAFYFLAAIFATIWMTSISLFMVATPEQAEIINWRVNWTFISAIFLDIAFLGYGTWQMKYGKYATSFFFILGLIISIIIALHPEYLYSSIALANTGNSVTMNMSPLYFCYVGFFGAIVPVIVASFFHQYLKKRNKNRKNGEIMTMISFGLSSLMVLIFNLIMPLFGNWSLIWIGPLSLAFTILTVYHTILRYRMINLSSIWLRIFSYVVVISTIAIIYMIVFSIVFAALFRGSTPSVEVIVLNFIMILFFIALIPVLNGLTAYIKNLISGQNTKQSIAKTDNDKDKNGRTANDA
ncbi:hypothetical protein J5491_04030 [Candidatus Saccharibacteria bacterium]|nr:hypothetical protein [Candidatus Saccharibacteria bacterium]